nr:hypothetical protein [uncultured Campylobacter sp.]
MGRNFTFGVALRRSATIIDLYRIAIHQCFMLSCGRGILGRGALIAPSFYVVKFHPSAAIYVPLISAELVPEPLVFGFK